MKAPGFMKPLVMQGLSLGIQTQQATKLHLHLHSINYTDELVQTRRALSNNLTNSHQEPVSGQACNASH